MSLYVELVKAAKESDTNIYAGVKSEILKVIDFLNNRVVNSAKNGFFDTTLTISRGTQPNILYIYGDLDCISSLEEVLNSLIDDSLHVTVRSGDSKDELFAYISWAGPIHMSIYNELVNGQ